MSCCWSFTHTCGRDQLQRSTNYQGSCLPGSGTHATGDSGHCRLVCPWEVICAFCISLLTHIQTVHGVALMRLQSDTCMQVCDFGLSLQMEHTETHLSNVYQGTMTHMAPGEPVHIRKFLGICVQHVSCCMASRSPSPVQWVAGRQVIDFSLQGTYISDGFHTITALTKMLVPCAVCAIYLLKCSLQLCSIGVKSMHHMMLFNLRGRYLAWL